MTPAAWIMLGVTWAVVTFFAGWFILRVLRLPQKGDKGQRGTGR